MKSSKKYCLNILSVVSLFAVISLAFSAQLLKAQYRRGAYDKKLLVAIHHDKDFLPRGSKYSFIRSIGSETDIVVYDMNKFTFYIDKDNSTEDVIDDIYTYDPNKNGSLKRISNPYEAGGFQKLKESIIKSGIKDRDSATYKYPGMDEMLNHMKKAPYSLKKNESGFIIQLKDQDSGQTKSYLAIDPSTSSLIIKNSFDYTSGRWIDSSIVYPVYARKTADPTIKKLIDQGTESIRKELAGRR